VNHCRAGLRRSGHRLPWLTSQSGDHEGPAAQSVTISHADPLSGLTVFERGWLSSNNVLVHAAPGEAGAWLVDTSHVNHAEQTLALVWHALAGRPLAAIANTHLHSDHCGGNATLQRAFGVPLAVPPGHAEAVSAWDESQLTYRLTGQRIEAFQHQAVLQPGQPVVAGGREWELLTAPGHDPHMLMLFDRANGVLVSADALWENGFGLVFPELQGEPGFDDVAAVLDLIAALPVRVVVPGHGRPFDDVGAALDRARERLRGMRSDPARHARHALKVMVKYHLMEEREQDLSSLLDWAETLPLFCELWQRFAPRGLPSTRAWVEQSVRELAASGALALHDGVVVDH
jgi:glyoxylase-like metal-dependent hydrolase (beta-lactamase superfamily II)